MRRFQKSWKKSDKSFIFKFILFPPILYFIIFVIFTFPAIFSFSTSLFADTGDGLQNIWNIWWINKAVTELHTSIWKTAFIHFPYGTTLIGHTLNPFNGMIGIILLKFMPIFQTYNFILIFTFIMGAVSAFILSFYIGRSYWGAILGGFIFSFGSFHFAHAEGHLQTVSLEWIPLFILLWIMFLKKPSIILALGSSLFLYLNLLSDYYFFFYCVITSIIIYIFISLRKKDVFFIIKIKYLFPLIIFIVVTFITSGTIISSLILQTIKDPLLGSHPAEMFSTDLLSVIIPGGHWRFGNLTYAFWSKLPGNIHESSVSVGLSVILFIIFVFIKRENLVNKNIGLWYFILLFFFILSLGPVIHIWGREIPYVFMPYSIAQKILPFLSLSGMPVRMMVMVNLASAVLCAMGVGLIRKINKFGLWLIVAIVIFMIVEYLPRALTITGITIPPYVRFLASVKNNSGILDMVEDKNMKLYYQTIHRKPIAFGYISRYPQSVLISDYYILSLLNDGRFDDLCHKYGLKYLVVNNKERILGNYKPVYNDQDIAIYDLGKNTDCSYYKK